MPISELPTKCIGFSWLRGQADSSSWTSLGTCSLDYDATVLRPAGPICSIATHMAGLTQEDPIGVAGGVNLYGYGEGDPVNNSDPFGLCPPRWLCALANASAGFGDAVTFGITDRIRNAVDANGVIDKESGSYFVGEMGGAAASIALGSATAGAVREGTTLATSGLGREAASRALGTRGGRALFGKGGALNSGQRFRLGVSRASDGGRYVFRATGDAVERAAGTRKIDILDLGKIEDYLRASGTKP